MSNAGPRARLMSEWVPDHMECLLHQLARDYHALTESYDRSVCTGPIVRGGIMPATAEQRALINRHAAEVRKRLLAEAMRLGFSDQDFQRAIVRHAKEQHP